MVLYLTLLPLSAQARQTTPFLVASRNFLGKAMPTKVHWYQRNFTRQGTSSVSCKWAMSSQKCNWAISKISQTMFCSNSVQGEVISTSFRNSSVATSLDSRKRSRGQSWNLSNFRMLWWKVHPQQIWLRSSPKVTRTSSEELYLLKTLNILII